MLRYTTYQGTIEDLVEFVNRVWEDAYIDKTTFPCWTVEFFKWQFGDGSDARLSHLLAAYDGTRLVGVLLGRPCLLRLPSGVIRGSQWSWLSIDSRYQGRGIARALDHERIKLLAATDSRLIISYRFVGSTHSKAERPSGRVSDRKFNRKIGFWARILDPVRFAAWNWNRFEGLLARMASPLSKVPDTTRAGTRIRFCTEFDIDTCVAVANDSFSGTSLAIEWDRVSMRHQLLGNPVSQTLVLEENGNLTGFINFHILPFRARTLESIGIIDMIAGGASTTKGCVQLINRALYTMKLQGAIVALKLRCGDIKSWPMWRTFFVPQPAGSFLVLQSVSVPVEVPSHSPIHVLWR